MNTERMKTYVAEINGEVIVAFRAEDDVQAYAMVNDENSGLQSMLSGLSGVRRADGSVLWDGETEIKARRATDAEHERWSKARDAEAEGDADREQIDPEMGDDADDFSICLVPIKRVDEVEADGAAV
jgi:hypothetical protein